MPTQRIEAARRELIKRGFCCLSGGTFGLPSYTHVEAWTRGSVLLYMLQDEAHDGWDLLVQIDNTNSIRATWEKVDTLIA